MPAALKIIPAPAPTSHVFLYVPNKNILFATKIRILFLFLNSIFEIVVYFAIMPRDATNPMLKNQSMCLCVLNKIKHVLILVLNEHLTI